MIPKVEFKFDEEKDIYNLWRSATHISRWHGVSKSISPNIIEACKDKKFEECKDKLRDIAKKAYENKLILTYKKALEESWGRIEKEYFNRMEKIFKRKFPFKKIKAYITTSGTCPYHAEEGWFMVSLFHSLPSSLVICGHELMHIFFCNTYWKDVEKKIGYDKTNDLKESLAEILNIEFRDLWIAKDMEYEPHQELRKFISKEWKKHKDFEILIKNSIKWIKKNGIK